MKKLYFVISLLLSSSAFANAFKPIISTNMGIINNSITETDSGIDNGNTTPTSASTSNIALDVIYEFKTYAQKTYFVRATTPIITSGQNGYFSASLGMNFYFNSLASVFSYEDDGTNIMIGPRLRYYIGPAIGVGYVIYTTDSAKKSDVSLDIDFHGGVLYNMSNLWGLRGELGLSRGTGVNTSSMNLKLFFGASFYFDPFGD